MTVGKRKRKPLVLNFIKVEGDVMQIIIDLIQLQIKPVLARYNCMPYTDSELRNMIKSNVVGAGS